MSSAKREHLRNLLSSCTDEQIERMLDVLHETQEHVPFLDVLYQLKSQNPNHPITIPWTDKTGKRWRLIYCPRSSENGLASRHYLGNGEWYELYRFEDRLGD